MEKKEEGNSSYTWLLRDGYHLKRTWLAGNSRKKWGAVTRNLQRISRNARKRRAREKFLQVFDWNGKTMKEGQCIYKIKASVEKISVD
jgi:hypothetical protein